MKGLGPFQTRKLGPSGFIWAEHQQIMKPVMRIKGYTRQREPQVGGQARRPLKKEKKNEI